MVSKLQVKLSKKAVKYIKKQDKPTRERLRVVLMNLAEEPPIGDIKAMQGAEKLYRLRVGNLRIIFNLDLSNNIILIESIAPRGDVYKKG